MNEKLEKLIRLMTIRTASKLQNWEILSDGIIETRMPDGLFRIIASFWSDGIDSGQMVYSVRGYDRDGKLAINQTFDPTEKTYPKAIYELIDDLFHSVMKSHSNESQEKLLDKFLATVG